MLVSVVVCAYRLDRYADLNDAVSSLLNQTHKETEIIVVIDGDTRLYDKIVRFSGQRWKNDGHRVKILVNEQNVGLSGSRNRGIREARGEIVAFVDDDAIAENTWIEELVKIYRDSNVIAVGGKILPLWISHRPDYLPEEMYWIVGATDRVFPEKGAEVRSTFGSNISFKREVFEKVGFFNEALGRRKERQEVSEETELSIRMQKKLGKGVFYNPEAVVYHKIFAYNIEPRFLLKRAFSEGYSKGVLTLTLSKDSIRMDKEYLNRLLLRYLPLKLRKLVKGPSRTAEVKQLWFLMTCLLSTGIGFLDAHLKNVRLRWAE